MSNLSQLKKITPTVENRAKLLQTIKIDYVDKIKEKDRSFEKIRFSFKFFDRTHPLFNLGETEKSWFLTLFDTLKEVSKYQWKDIHKNKTYDAHPIDWKKTNATFNCDPAALEQFDAYQFRLDKSHGRVSGFLLGNIFYIYWLDSEHNLWDSEGYAKAYKMHPPKTCYELIKEENMRLHEQIKKLQSEIDILLE
ncbi:MAG: hypothetical protein WCY05_07385 [Candidatus Omnitrophota bacterium]